MDIIASGVTELYTPHAKVHKSASNVITINIVDDTVQYSTVPNNKQWPLNINSSNLEPLFEKPTAGLSDSKTCNGKSLLLTFTNQSKKSFVCKTEYFVNLL